ncbi:MAG TPA: carbohydrate kinase family protein [Chloroflexia bacterium]|jgi:adenosine kinase|nr:carbohydrate kinase family protein [Chloroflexia bacterium]
MSIVVTGSVAYDNIMDFPGHFHEHILADKIHMLNVSFLVDTLKKQRGGCAGNIAYSLALLGSHPKIYSTVGPDFSDYRSQLESIGVDTSTIREVTDQFTATCFITTDRDNNQITGFYPGAMARDAQLSLAPLGLGPQDLVVISPTEPEAMTRFARECRAGEVPYVYVPAQQIIRLSAEDLLTGIEGARVIIANDYEYEMMHNKTGLTAADMLRHAEVVVKTRGEAGSVVRTRDAEYTIPIAQPREVVDPTGAGDAYAAGFVHGLTQGFDPAVTGRIAALAAVYVIEYYGTQAHSYSRAEFAARYAENFGTSIQL